MIVFTPKGSHMNKRKCESVKLLVTQLCPTLCNPMGCSPPGSFSMEFSRQEYWTG